MELILDNLTKEFGNFTAVDHITLSMTNGVYGLLGGDWAGKSKFIRKLCKVLEHTSGNI